MPGVDIASVSGGPDSVPDLAAPSPAAELSEEGDGFIRKGSPCDGLQGGPSDWLTGGGALGYQCAMQVKSSHSHARISAFPLQYMALKCGRSSSFHLAQ